MSFLAELKRRNVIRMAGLYVVGAWLVVQVAETLLPIFGTPDWVLKALVVLLAIGFIPALVFSWIFELTPEGLKRESEIPPDASVTPQTARRMDRTIIVVLLLALGYFAFDKFVLGEMGSGSLSQDRREAPPAGLAGESEPDPVSAASIAVLPFVNMSTDVENGFFADGISEELLNVLAGIDGLKVASRTSSFSFKGKDTPIPEIARQLDVRHVLEGSVRKQGQRVRITAQLIHAGTDGHLWSKTYDRDLVDIFKVQEEIAQAITGELEGLLGKRQVAVTASTADFEAYQSFLRGRARFHARDALLAAVEDLSGAVARDPAFADAWVYLAATWMVAPGYLDETELAVAEALTQTRAALARAEALVPRHPMVLAVRAQQLEADGDFTGAIALLETAAASGAQDSNPMLWHGLVLLRSGYVEEATAVLERARTLDPLAGINNGYLALAYLSDGRNAEAEATARRALAQGWSPAMSVIIYDLAARGERERAVALWDELVPEDLVGKQTERAQLLRALLRDPSAGGASIDADTDDRTIDIETFIALGRFDRMLDLAEQVQKLDRSDRRRHWWLRSAWLPSTLALREQPRFFAFAEEIGMVRVWETRRYPDGCTRVAAAGGDHLDCLDSQP